MHFALTGNPRKTHLHLEPRYTLQCTSVLRSVVLCQLQTMIPTPNDLEVAANSYATISITSNGFLSLSFIMDTRVYLLATAENGFQFKQDF